MICVLGYLPNAEEQQCSVAVLQPLRPALGATGDSPGVPGGGLRMHPGGDR